MKALKEKGKVKGDPPQKRRTSPQRRGLLAKVHIAKKELGIPDDDYRAIFKWEFGKRSAKQLTMIELEYLVDYFKSKGWKIQGSRFKGSKINPERGTVNLQNQLEALRARAWELARQIENGDRRLRGLAKKILGVDCLTWCRDAHKLRRLLAALEKIKKSQPEWD